MTRLEQLKQKGYTVRPDLMRRLAVFVSKDGIHKWYPNVSTARREIVGY